MQPKLGIIAGSGELPALLIQSCLDSDRKFFVIAFTGQTNPNILKNYVSHAWVRLGAAGKTLRLLRQEGVEEIVLAGGIERPAFRDLRPDWWAIKFFALSGAAFLGDDGLLTALIRSIEKEGFKVIGAEQLLPEIIAPDGVFGAIKPNKKNYFDIETARQAALALGVKDKGQGAIAHQGNVLIVEGKNGTDHMISCLPNLRNSKKGGVLVKVCKPGQETRADLPTIGVSTIRLAAEAGLDGIAVQRGKALVVDIDTVVRVADEKGIFVVGIEDKAPLVYIIAGEVSGDLLGSRIMARIKEKNNNIHFVGVGGKNMKEQGLDCLFPIEEVSLMGLTEIIPHMPKLLKRIRETVTDVKLKHPDVLLTIDSPGFCFRVAKKLKNENIKLIHYVAPSVWAWKPGRAKKVAMFLDHLLTLLPFEPQYFEPFGLKTTFVGHSVLESGADKGDGKKFRERHGISQEAKIMVMLPGSRSVEIQNLLDIFGITAINISKKYSNFVIIIPTLAPLVNSVRNAVSSWPINVKIVENEKEKYDAFDAADIGLAASGTVSLELAMAGTPSIIAYKIHPISAWLVKRVVKTSHANLINILLNREVIPEFLQENCRSDLLQASLELLLENKTIAQNQIKIANQALEKLGKGGVSSSKSAAEIILSMIKEGKAK